MQARVSKGYGVNGPIVLGGCNERQVNVVAWPTIPIHLIGYLSTVAYDSTYRYVLAGLGKYRTIHLSYLMVSGVVLFVLLSLFLTGHWVV
jgi:hypothetical protein